MRQLDNGSNRNWQNSEERDEKAKTNTNTKENQCKTKTPSESITTEQAPTPFESKQTPTTNAEEEVDAFIVDGSINQNYLRAYIKSQPIREEAQVR